MSSLRCGDCFIRDLMPVPADTLDQLAAELRARVGELADLRSENTELRRTIRNLTAQRDDAIRATGGPHSE